MQRKEINLLEVYLNCYLETGRNIEHHIPLLREIILDVYTHVQ